MVADLDHYRSRARRGELSQRYSWQDSERRLADLYSELLGRPVTPPTDDADFPSLEETGEEVRSEGGRVSIDRLFARLPLAVLRHSAS